MAETIEAEVYLWCYEPPHHDKVYLSQVIRAEPSDPLTPHQWYHVTAYARRGKPLVTRRDLCGHSAVAWDQHTRRIGEKLAKGYRIATREEVLKGGPPAPPIQVTQTEPLPPLTPRLAAAPRKIFELDAE